MIEDRVVAIFIPSRQNGEGVWDRRHLFVEDFVAKPLRALDVALGAGEPHFEIADAAIDLMRLEAIAEAQRPQRSARPERKCALYRLQQKGGKHHAWAEKIGLGPSY